MRHTLAPLAVLAVCLFALAVAVMDIYRQAAEVPVVVEYPDPARADYCDDLPHRIWRAASLAGVPTDIAFSLVMVESSFDSLAVSSAGAVGLAQVKPSTARIYEPDVTRADLLTVDTNLRIGFRYLRDLYERFGSWERALTAYNHGPTRVSRRGYSASRYSAKVMEGAGR